MLQYHIGFIGSRSSASLPFFPPGIVRFSMANVIKASLA